MLISQVDPEIPVTSGLDLHNFPNPFSLKTNINFSLSQKEITKLSIFDLYGQEIDVPVIQIMPKGPHLIEFGASGLINGTYICRTSNRYRHYHK